MVLTVLTATSGLGIISTRSLVNGRPTSQNYAWIMQLRRVFLYFLLPPR